MSLLSLFTMNKFKRGDILRGDKRKFKESYHPVVYIDGTIETPLAVVLTHTTTEENSCNRKLLRIYDKKDGRPQYFVAHLIQKMSEWGPYSKEGELVKEDLELIENTVSGMKPITWAKYEYSDYKKNRCPEHRKI